jgi:hypothetical protein
VTTRPALLSAFQKQSATPIQRLPFSTRLNQGVTEQRQGPYFLGKLNGVGEPTEAFCVGGGRTCIAYLYPRTSHGCNGVPKPSQAVSGTSPLSLQPRRQSWSYRHGFAVDALRRASRAAKSAKAGGSAATASPAKAEAAGVAFTSQSGPPQLADLKPSCAEYVSDADGITKASVAPKYECFAWRSFAYRRECNTRRVPLERLAEALERRPGDIKVVIDSLQ